MIRIKMYVSTFEIGFCLGKGERFQMDASGNPVMQTAPVVNHFLNHPRGCGTANDNDYILINSPAIPEKPQSPQKTGFVGGQP